MSAVPAVPRATLRLQLGPAFDFDAAAAVVPYAHALGISHLYLSPILAAMPGSTHGYDVVDHDRVSPALGGEAGLRRLVAVLRRHGMGLVIDVVPNHMAAGGDDNHRWQALLTWGAAAPEAGFFALDRRPGQPLALPLLPAPLQQVLAAGELRPGFDAGRGWLYLDCAGQRLSLAAHSYAPLLAAAGLPRLAEALALRGDTAAQRRRHLAGRAVLTALSAAQRRRLHAALTALAADDEAARTRLHALLDAQHYQLLPWWQAATRCDYRRFFNVNGLIALRSERPAVFEATHATLLRLYAEGLIDGLRIDHVDGLADPRGYCRRLRARLVAAGRRRSAARPWIVVEKILAEDEWLRSDWPVQGTTGYDFLEAVSALLHDAGGARELDRLWRRSAGPEARDFAGEVRIARREIVEALFAGDVDRVTRALQRVARRRGEAAPPLLLRQVVVELLVALPAYRDYTGRQGRDPEDAQLMRRAVAAASTHGDAALRQLLPRVDRWLGGEAEADVADAVERRLRRQARLAFQQLAPAVAAKAEEDTAFYRYGRLLSRNEVGGAPARLGISVDGFHRRNRLRLARHPTGLLATASHDHKRGEDLRMRLAVLSERPAPWRLAVAQWRLMNLAARRHIDAPDAADELMLYQMIVGAWPSALAVDDAAGLATLAQRLRQWQRKALRESRRHSSWQSPDPVYEDACDAFLDHLLRARDGAPFRASMQAMVADIAPAAAVKGLTQALLRLSAPGVADLYQGTEFWDHSLVDPDNRRPVDFGRRIAALASRDDDAHCLQAWRDGRVKQRLIARMLRLRKAMPALFTEGDYLPLRLQGRQRRDFVALARCGGGQALLLVAPWRLHDVLAPGAGLELDPAAVADLQLRLPPALRGLAWRSVLDASAVAAATGAALPLAALLARWPLAVLHSGPAARGLLPLADPIVERGGT